MLKLGIIILLGLLLGLMLAGIAYIFYINWEEDKAWEAEEKFDRIEQEHQKTHLGL